MCGIAFDDCSINIILSPFFCRSVVEDHVLEDADFNGLLSRESLFILLYQVDSSSTHWVLE